MSLDPKAFDAVCPLPLRHTTVQLAHGGGGRAMRELVDQVFLSAFDNPVLRTRHDSALLPPSGGRLAFTSDAYVVRPLFFPGGDVGKLAVTGTVNDLAMAGALPRYLSASFVLEEGLEIASLTRIAASMARAAEECGVSIVTGDTKVVDRGHGDGVYIATSGVGLVPDGVEIAPRFVEAGDAVLVSGDVGRHGIAVLSVREGLGFDGSLESDCAGLSPQVQALLADGVRPHCLRDLTRGGLAAALSEIALDADLVLAIDEARIPVSEVVRGACEILGLDPLSVACEGRFVAFVPEADAERALGILRASGAEPARIGRVAQRSRPRAGCVELLSGFGGTRLLDLPYGEQLPRIC